MSETTPNLDVMERLRAKSQARAKIVEEIAGILWQNGEMLADTEGGAMPSWIEVLSARSAVSISEEHKEACWAWWLENTHRAEALLSIAPADALVLAKHLIDSAARQQEMTERSLWARIEKARTEAQV
jgi:hypothetical protein